MIDLRPPAAIFDIDGTLCDVRRIRHYVIDPNRRDFDAFHRASSFCPPNEAVLDLLRRVARAGITPLTVTARPDNYRDITEGWCEKSDIRAIGPWMRKLGDRRRDHVVKAEILAELQRRWLIVLAVDDNPEVLDLWHKEGIETVIVPGWGDSASLMELDKPVTITFPKWLSA